MKTYRSWLIILVLVIGTLIFQSCKTLEISVTPGGSIFSTPIHTIRIVNGLKYDVRLSCGGYVRVFKPGGGISIPFKKKGYDSSIACDGTVYNGKTVIGTTPIKKMRIPKNRSNKGNTVGSWHIASYKKSRQ